MASSRPLESLRQQLDTARSYDAAVRKHNASGKPLDIPGTGKTISSAYEQLRNAAEYTEGRIILQRAIKRFYKRLLFVVKQQPESVGKELIIDLVLSGYLQEDKYGSDTVKAISNLAVEYMDIYKRLRESHVPPNLAHEWVLSVLSVRTEDLLRPYAYNLALATFAYEHFLEQLPRKRIIGKDKEAGKDYDFSLYVAVHQGLLKSSIDVVRTDILRLFCADTSDILAYAQWNERIDRLYTSRLTLRLKRMVSKNGAPFRILKSLIDDNPNLPEILPNQEQFMNDYGNQIAKEYARTDRRLNRGLIKSILFIFITKTIIGLGVEVPFDLIVYGMVFWIPLTINLLFPPLYMASIRLGITMPSSADARASLHYIEDLLYGDSPPSLNVTERTKPYSLLAKIASALLFLIPLAITTYILYRLGFNPLQMLIFFVFFSTASFLGFRLSSIVRELKMIRPKTNFLSLVLDVFYLPFIQVGQWLAGKYARINIVGDFLDIAIELPLKTVLHTIRLWIRFLNEKYDELY
jgi:hypothetical protein